MALREFSADHPKAKLMARKRAAILMAAREAFLREGYGDTSMEAIAASAGVSIATLYRHAAKKDDLFAAVVSDFCNPDAAEQAEGERILRQPLDAVLLELGLMVQQKLADPERVALLRVVMAETVRFPELAQIAYDGLVDHLDDMVRQVLAAKPESAHLTAAECRELSGMFIDRLCGVDMLRVLLGLKGVSQAEQKRRAERARDEVMATLRPA